MLTKLFADRLAPEGIFVYEIRPGVIRTDMTSQVEEKYTELIRQGMLPIARWGVPEDVAKAVRAQLETVLTHFPPVRIDMTEEERYNAALALTSALPERAFTGEYDRLFGPDESEKENAS